MLVRILDRQAPLATEPGRAVELALLRAQIFDEKLHDVDAAAEALERLIAEIDPRNAEAHARLRAYYEQDDDWPKVVKIAERQLCLTDDPRRAGARARWSWRRSSATSWATTARPSPSTSACWRSTPTIWQALEAVAGLYGKTGNYQRLAYADEKLLERTEDPEARRTAPAPDRRHLRDASRRRRAAVSSGTGAPISRAPTAENLQLVDQAAERHGLFDELIQIYEGARARASEPFEQLAASLKIALICEEKLNDPARAFQTLVDALPTDPAGDELLPQPRAAGRAHRRLEAPARRLRPGGAGAHRDRRAGRAPAAAGRGAREAHGRSLGGARRDAAQLRHRAAQPRGRRRRSCVWPA